MTPLMDARRRARQEQTADAQMTLDQERARLCRQEQYLVLQGLLSSLTDGIGLLSPGAEGMTIARCDRLTEILHEVTGTIQGAIASFEAADLGCGARPYPILLQLWTWHRLVMEAQVLACGVRGLCKTGRVLSDWSGCYWQLRETLQVIIQRYQALLRSLAVEVVPLSVQTDTCLLQCPPAQGSYVAAIA